jgi:hypothetical protein
MIDYQPTQIAASNGTYYRNGCWSKNAIEIKLNENYQKLHLKIDPNHYLNQQAKKITFFKQTFLYLSKK